MNEVKPYELWKTKNKQMTYGCGLKMKSIEHESQSEFQESHEGKQNHIETNQRRSTRKSKPKNQNKVKRKTQK